MTEADTWQQHSPELFHSLALRHFDAHFATAWPRVLQFELVVRQPIYPNIAWSSAVRDAIAADLRAHLATSNPLAVLRLMNHLFGRHWLRPYAPDARRFRTPSPTPRSPSPLSD